MTQKPSDKTPKNAVEVCIDLPGEGAQCWVTTNKVRIVLRKWRDVFFDVNIQAGTIYTIESKDMFYDTRVKARRQKVEFADGEKLHIWVGREFQGNLILKLNNKVLGNYEVKKLDTTIYGADPKVKPEPLLIVMGKRELNSLLPCTTADPFGLRASQPLLNNSVVPKAAALKNFGSEFSYTLPAEAPIVEEYVAVTEADTDEIQPHVLQQLESGTAVTGTPGQIFVSPKTGSDPSLLYRAMAAATSYIAGSQFLTSNWFKESIGYLHENFKSLDRLSMRVRIEKRVKGKYRVVFKGRPLSQQVFQAIGRPNPVTLDPKKTPVGSASTRFIDAGFERTGKAGFGGFKRIMLTSTKNFAGGLKIQAIGTVIDLIFDYNTVFVDEKGSKDISEFLGRAGVSIAKAGLTAALGSAVAAVVMMGLAAVGAPVIIIVGIIVLGYIGAAMVVDFLDDSMKIKERVAASSR